MKILILGYSNLCKRKIIPLLSKKFNKIKFCVCSKTQRKKNIGAYEWYRNCNDALEKSKADLVYISLINSQHYYWAKKSLEKNDSVTTLFWISACGSSWLPRLPCQNSKGIRIPSSCDFMYSCRAFSPSIVITKQEIVMTGLRFWGIIDAC